jgi:hypothetical protein
MRSPRAVPVCSSRTSRPLCVRSVGIWIQIRIAEEPYIPHVHGALGGGERPRLREAGPEGAVYTLLHRVWPAGERIEPSPRRAAAGAD